MSKVVSLDAKSIIEDTAIKWICRIDSGLSDSEKAEFNRWLCESERHQSVFLAYAKLWDKMDCLSMLSELVPQPKESQNKRFYFVAASFVTVCLLLFAGFQSPMVHTWLSPQAELLTQQVFTTDIGQQSTFYMQDKTKVMLNTNSELRVTYTNKQRLLELIRGEMFVEVAHDQMWPLSVHASNQRIQAVGTAFSVEMKEDAVELIVTDGKVLVAEKTEKNNNPLQYTDIRLPDDALAVAHGQGVELGNRNASVLDLSSNDVDVKLSWQSGELVFRGESLAEALAEVSRYTSYSFKFEQDSMRSLRIAGLFKTDDLEGFLDALALNLSIEHSKISSETILLSRAR